MSATADNVKPFSSWDEFRRACKREPDADFFLRVAETPRKILTDNGQYEYLSVIASATGLQDSEILERMAPEPDDDEPTPPPPPPKPKPSEGKAYASKSAAWADINAVEPGDDIGSIKAKLRLTPPNLIDEDERAKMAKDLAQKTGGSVVALRKAIAFDRKAAKANDKKKEKDFGHPDETIIELSRFNKTHAVLQLGSKVRVIQQHGRRDEMPEALEVDGFKVLHGNRFVEVLDNGEPKQKSIANAWLTWGERRTFYRGVMLPYAPGQPNPADKLSFNYWNGYGTDPDAKGDWSLLRTHVRDTMCHSNPIWLHWFMTWNAHIVRHPEKKMPTAVGVSGKRGTGKTKYFEWFQRIIGDVHARKINQPRHLVGHFNALQFGLILLILEEALWSGDKQASNTTKDIISSDRMEIEKKGIDPKTCINVMRLVFISNEEWHMPVAGDDERRYFVLEIKDTWARGNGREEEGIRLFKAIDAQMERGGAGAMLAELLSWDPVREAQKLLAERDGLTEDQRAYLTRAAEFGWDILRMAPVTEWQHVQAAHGLEVADAFVRDGYMHKGWRAPNGSAFPEAVVLSDADTLDIPVREIQDHWAEACRRDGSQKKAKDIELLRGALVRCGMIDPEPTPGGVMGEGESWRFRPLSEVTPPAAWRLSEGKIPEDVQGLAAEFAAAIRAGQIMASDVLTDDEGRNWFHRRVAEHEWRAFLNAKGVHIAHPGQSAQGMKAIEKALDATIGQGKRIGGRWDRAWHCPAW